MSQFENKTVIVTGGAAVVHTEVIQLCASPAQVKEFIMTPERILDYYPSGIDCGVIEPGRSLCTAKW